MSETKLIVLGNGFDLACGLNSRYADFFKERIPNEVAQSLTLAWQNFNEVFRQPKSINTSNINFETIFDARGRYLENRGRNSLTTPKFNLDKQLLENIKTAKLSFWDIVLFYFQEFEDKNLEDVKWQDIESRMLDFLTKDITGKPQLNKLLNDTQDGRLDKINWFCLHITALISDRHIQYEGENFLQYIYDELVLFEQAFVKFLNSELTNNPSYHPQALDLLLKMTGEKDRLTLIESPHKIMSFNYTAPLKGIDITNVHGTLKSGKIIFGIDQEKIDVDDAVFRFTKTFRQMTETPISKKNGQSILPRKEELREIVFFGHSLSPLDYSYFQTLFDYYNLYDSDVKLIFFYKVYTGTTSLNMELDLSEKISKMLREYALSIDNEKKGKNLMHKLLLEKRLNIEEAPLFQIVSN